MPKQPRVARRRRQAAASEAAAWRERHDALLDVLNAILLANGGRMRIGNGYVGQPRRHVAIEPVTDGGIIVILEGFAPSAKED